MRQNRRKLFFVLLALLILIFDSKTALDGANSGIKLCLYTVVPALFPFIFLSSILVDELSGKRNRILRKISLFLGMPPGSEGFLLAGFLGGYPTGATCIATSYRSGQIRKGQAEHLMGFCNNAGPAFIFGIAASMFSPSIAWILWGIHILSALLTAYLAPGNDFTPVHVQKAAHFSATAALIHTMHVMASICGWVTLFRILITFCDRWFMWLLPKTIQILLSGILELSNGCCCLVNLESPQLRFILFSFFLSFGGICVIMQTATTAAPLSLRHYIAEKFVQATLSILLSIIALPFIYGWSTASCVYLCVTLSAIIPAILLAHRRRKIAVAFPKVMMYNT